MSRTSRAIVRTAPRTLELRELPLPEIGPDDALLQVEACGICGSDYERSHRLQYVRGGVMVTKPEFMKALDELPEEATIRDAIEHLLYLQAIEQGLADEKAGRLIPHEEVLDEIKSWLK